MKGLVSIVVPVYNVKKYLDECMESIVNQTYRDIEIILVDDGSTDGSGEKCEEWGQKDSRIKVIHQTNGGLSAARNTGIDAASGEYIAFIDSDDYFELNAIESLYNCATSLSADLVVGQGLRVWDDGTVITEGKYADKYEPDGQEVLITKEDFWRRFSDNIYFVVAWSKLYKKELFDKVKFPVGKINEDFAIAIPISEEADTIASMGKRIYKYRIRQGSIMRTPLSEKNLYAQELRLELMKYILKQDYSSDSKYYICRIQLSNAIRDLARLFKAIGKDKDNKKKLLSLYKEYKSIAKAICRGIDGTVKPDKSTKVTLTLFMFSRRLYYFFRGMKNSDN